MSSTYSKSISNTETTSTERRKHKVRVPRKLDENGNPVPHRHFHANKLHKHPNGNYTTNTNPNSTEAISLYPNTTKDVTSFSNTSILEKEKEKEKRRHRKRDKNGKGKEKRYVYRAKNGKRLHIDKMAGDFRGRPLHIFESLDFVNYDSAAGDDFAQLERERDFDPKRILKENPKFRGKHFVDTTTYSASTIDTGLTVPSTVEDTEGPPRTKQTFTSFMGSTRELDYSTYNSDEIKLTTESSKSVQTYHPDAEQRKRELKDPFNKPKLPYSLEDLVPQQIQYSLFDQYEQGNAITKLEDIVIDDGVSTTVDSFYVPPEPSNEYTTMEEFISASTGSAEYVQDDTNTEAETLVSVTRTTVTNTASNTNTNTKTSTKSSSSSSSSSSTNTTSHSTHSTHEGNENEDLQSLQSRVQPVNEEEEKAEHGTSNTQQAEEEEEEEEEAAEHKSNEEPANSSEKLAPPPPLSDTNEETGTTTTTYDEEEADEEESYYEYEADED